MGGAFQPALPLAGPVQRRKRAGPGLLTQVVEQGGPHSRTISTARTSGGFKMRALTGTCKAPRSLRGRETATGGWARLTRAGRSHGGPWASLLEQTGPRRGCPELGKEGSGHGPRARPQGPGERSGLARRGLGQREGGRLVTTPESTFQEPTVCVGQEWSRWQRLPQARQCWSPLGRLSPEPPGGSSGMRPQSQGGGAQRASLPHFWQHSRPWLQTLAAPMHAPQS